MLKSFTKTRKIDLTYFYVLFLNPIRGYNISVQFPYIPLYSQVEASGHDFDNGRGGRHFFAEKP